jgi:hypothetical protein
LDFTSEMTKTNDTINHQFLVLGISVQANDKKSDENIIRFPCFRIEESVSYHLRKINDGGDPKGIFSRAFWVIDSASGIPLREAYHYAHGIEALIPICRFCIAQSVDHLIRVMPLPESVAANQSQRISADDLVQASGEDLSSFFGGEDLFRTVYGTCKVETHDRAKAMAPYLRNYAAVEAFARGCSYLHLSMTELGIDVCDWSHQDYDQSFYRYVSVSRAESAFLNAFKVIESVVGEPSKNRAVQKLSSKLNAQGIDPSEKVGYRDKKSILERILIYHPLRDKIAAHGIGKVKRDLKLSEIIELQALARYVLLTAKFS